MAKRGLQPPGVARRNKIILSAVKRFLEKGNQVNHNYKVFVFSY